MTSRCDTSTFVCMNKRDPNPVPFLERAALTKNETAFVLSCGGAKVRDLIKAGLLDVADLDKMERITVASVKRLLAAGGANRKRRARGNPRPGGWP